ncbi:MAG: YbaY family lipoprotein [Sphingomonadaceae bacterium]
MRGPRTVRGQVRMLEALEHPEGVLYVRVEDVSRADAAAEVVAEVAFPINRQLAVGESLPFSLTVPEVDDRAHYSLRAHLDTTGSGRIEPGDRISIASHPVITFGYPDEAVLDAHKV